MPLDLQGMLQMGMQRHQQQEHLQQQSAAR